VSGPGVARRPWGRTRDGVEVELFTLTNRGGLSAAVATYGATVVSLRAPDRQGRLDEVVLGHDRLDGYLDDGRSYLGATVGRSANRIARGELPIDGRVHRLACNDGAHHLHGGRRGFDKVVWTAEAAPAGRAGVLLRRVSPDGEEGYPGALAATVAFELTDQDELAIEATATCDAPTVCNLSHHGYFNLERPVRRDVLGHRLWIDADRVTCVGPGLIPTGELSRVDGTPLDFRTPTPIGARLGVTDGQLALAGGYDHNWVLNRAGGAGLALAARLAGPETGRTLEVWTTEPGLQFYSGNFLDGSLVGRGGEAYGRHAGLCLEAQHFPDSPHQPGFPSTMLRPGERYRTRTVYRVGVER
jgi:aldose 1-epimerase